MIKLLRANFMRLSKSKVFFLCLAALFIFSAANTLSSVSSIASYAEDGTPYTLEMAQFDMLPIAAIFCAVFCSLFFGTEYSDLTIRNKLTVGHSKADIYISNFITACFGNIMLLASWFISGILGFKDFGVWAMGTSELLKYLAVTVLFTIASTALLTAIFMLCSNKAIASVASILVVLGILVVSSVIYNNLCEPEIMPGMASVVDNQIVVSEPTVNDYYVGGTARVILTAVLNILPAGQAIITSNLEITQPLIMCLYSVGVTVFALIVGIALFRKKDLK